MTMINARLAAKNLLQESIERHINASLSTKISEIRGAGHQKREWSNHYFHCRLKAFQHVIRILLELRRDYLAQVRQYQQRFLETV